MKNILVISASPRKGGNSDVLCDEFIKGAQQAGHKVEKIFLRNFKVNYCTGRCCQLIINSAQRITWKEVKSIEELGESERGNKGFGEGTGGAAKA